MPLFGRKIRRVQEKLRRRRQSESAATAGPPATPVTAPSSPPAEAQTVAQWLDGRWPALRPIRTFPTPSQGKRISIVTDGVDSGRLFGGVGTALVLGALLANRMRATLRLVTRMSPPDPRVLKTVLAANGVVLDEPFQAVFAPLQGGRELPVSEDDCFISTSWWTTRSLLGAVRRDRLAYLLQEDERMFYPFGDERLRCERTLMEPDLVTVVNTRLLFDHLAGGPEALPGFAGRASSFEPAFPGGTAPEPRPTAGGRRRLFFYARPNNLRNLFDTGIEALAGAVADGTLHPARWEILLVGKDVPDLLLPGGMRPQRIEGLSWTDYQALVRTVDAGFVLMDTPHPSYPPLDLAAAGAAVLTNTRGNKQSLASFSANILTAEPTLASLRRGLQQLATLAGDEAARAVNRGHDGICRDWNSALAGTVERLAAHFGGEAEREGRWTLPMTDAA